MAKVGLKATLALLAKGYSKKEIDELAAIDEEQEKKDPEPEKKDPEPKEDPEPEKKDPEPKEDPEPDYKKLYEDLLKDNQEKDKQIKEIQKDNINSDSLPELEKQYEEELNSLNDAFKSFY